MDYFYDGQLRRYLTQFMRVMSNFSYKDSKGNLVQIPVRYGDMSRQVAQILNKNSENTIPSAPFISCYIKNLKIARERLQNPYYENTLNVRERADHYMDEDPSSPTYGEIVQGAANTQGANYTINRLMPTPYDLEFQADIWSSNTEQKLQILEQILVLFRPAMEIQTTSNFVDWTSLSYLELSDLTWSTRAIPQGVEQDIDIANLSFTTPIWISTPIKVKQLGVITNIINNIFVEPTGSIEANPYDDGAFFNGRKPTAVAGHSLKNLNIIVLNNTATLGPNVSWFKILDAYPGTFVAGVSQIRFTKDLETEVVATMTLNPTDETQMILNIDASTLHTNSQVPPNSGKTYVDAIIDPTTFTTDSNNVGIRYLILEDINPAYRQVQYIANPGYDPNNPDSPQQLVKLDANGNPVYQLTHPDTAYAVKNFKNADGSVFSANANDIISWDGTSWSVIFDSLAGTVPTYITNIRTGSQYSWDGQQWTSSYEGEYTSGYWRLLL
jgi:hypothetical protein